MWSLEVAGTQPPMVTRFERSNLLDSLHARWVYDGGTIVRDTVGLWTPYETTSGVARFHSSKGWLWGRTFWRRDMSQGARYWSAQAERFMWSFPLTKYRLCMRDDHALSARERLALVATVVISDIQNDLGNE